MVSTRRPEATDLLPSIGGLSLKAYVVDLRLYVTVHWWDFLLLSV